MAGTRLAIQGTFVVEFLLLAMAAVYFGLYGTKDPIRSHLPTFQRGRALITECLQTLDSEFPAWGPLIQIATTQQYAPLLQGLAQEIIGLSIDIRVEDDLACRADEADRRSVHSIRVCPSESEAPSMVLHKGTTVLHPGTRNPQEVRSLLIRLLSTNDASSSRRPLKVSLVMEPRQDWDAWVQALSSWLLAERLALESWPCIRGGMDTTVRTSPLPDAAQRSTIPTQTMKARLVDHPDFVDPDAWNVLLYVPRVSLLLFRDPSGNKSNSFHVDNTLVTTIDRAETRIQKETIATVDADGNETKTVQTTEIRLPVEELVRDAMTPITEFLLQRCMGMSPTIIVVSDSDPVEDASLPRWQLEAWLQRQLKDKYRQAVLELRQEGEWLLQSSTWVVIDQSVAAHWQRMEQSMLVVKQILSSHHTGYSQYLEALAILEDVLDYLQKAVRTNPILMEPLRFSAPQFLAIFAPLCLPLFLPHLIGLVREYKRYKNLLQKRKPL